MLGCAIVLDLGSFRHLRSHPVFQSSLATLIPLLSSSQMDIGGRKDVARQQGHLDLVDAQDFQCVKLLPLWPQENVSLSPTLTNARLLCPAGSSRILRVFHPGKAKRPGFMWA